ncbi:MAG: hypothetical protein HYV15_01640 [Elusimicrobia bacterium]|nr:hypothetical protein [Elusimicrobiota bacterium]
MKRHQLRLDAVLGGFLLLAAAGAARAQEEAAAEESDQSESMVAVSADVVEISGSVSKDIGFSWAPFTTGINFAEKTPIPGIIKVANFERLTQMQTSLKMLETEGKAQLLSNPKIITKNAVQANFVVGGDQPYPVTNNQGVGVEFKKFGVILNILPVINPNKKASPSRWATRRSPPSSPARSRPRSR